MVNHYVATALTAAITWCLVLFCRQVLRIFGKYDALSSAHRKFLSWAGGLILFAGLLYSQQVLRTLRELSAASPMKGGFRANFISLSYVGKMTVLPLETTNQLTATASMSGIGVPNPASQGKDGVNLLLVVKIDNSGQPSTAWKWKTYVTLAGGSRVDAFIPSVSIPDGQVVPTVIGPYVIKMENNLIQALATNPLQTGAGKIGWLVVQFPGVTEIPVGAHVHLDFEDVYDRPTKIDFVWAKPP